MVKNKQRLPLLLQRALLFKKHIVEVCSVRNVGEKAPWAEMTILIG